MIEVVESVYEEPSPPSMSFQETVVESVTHKRKSESHQFWYNNSPVEQVECDNYYQKDHILENNGIDPNIDATDLLFLSYSRTLKNFSKKRQIQVKMKISEIMCQAELDEEEQQSCVVVKAAAESAEGKRYSSLKASASVKRETDVDTRNETFYDEESDQADSPEPAENVTVKNGKRCKTR